MRHLIGKVHGNFQKFSGKFEFEPGKPAKWKAEATIDVASINTNVEKRDQHLRSKDFFDVENKEHLDYATMKFVSTKVTEVKENKAKLHGNLSIHGITKPVVLDLDIGGEATDPWGNKKAAFSAATTINRKDFGLTWNQTLEAGGVLVGDDVEITLEVEGNKK
ncbi:MAG TPA: YceI family protein [Bdellovibrionota bacterium]|nr:YceI family protein [Bdellovibrionota bacterium]